MRKLMTAGVIAVAGVLAFSADAQAFGKRKKNKGCDSCATAAPVATGCGGCGGGMAYAGGPGGYALAPEAMPATGTATTTQPGTVVPATGTTGGTVVPAGGLVVPQGSVVPAGGYVLDGQYVTPAGYTTVVEPSGTNSRTRRGILRR